MSMIKVRSIKKRNKMKSEPKPIRWGGDDPFTHTLCVGPTRCGKTATVLKPLIYSILLAKKKGIPVGLSVIEPKGDVARLVKEMALEMDLYDELVYIDPLYPDETHRINVMKGDKNDVAEATVAVLKSLFGKQDPFFATVQELSSRKVTLLLKELYGDNMDIMDVLANLRDEGLLKNNVERLRQMQGTNDLVQFFDNELLGSSNLAEKYRQFIVGLRAQLENITSNEHLKTILTGKSDIDLDCHFLNGHILAVNTALGKLGRAGDAFGMFIAMHLQLATFRRPGTERTRIPHYVIIDEYSRYINPDVERFLSIAAEYRVALIAAIQSLGQLELESGQLSAKAMKKAILTSTRNKIIFGGLEYEDADEVAKIMGKNVIKERSRTFGGGILDNILPKHYKEEENEKERFYSTFVMDGLPRFHYIHKLLVNGTPQEPGIGVGTFVPRDWKEQLETEQKTMRKPSILDWRKRAEYEVKQQRLKEAEGRRKKMESLNPFGEEEEPFIPMNSLKTVKKTIFIDEDQLISVPIQAALPEIPEEKINQDEHVNRPIAKTQLKNNSEKTDIVFSLVKEREEDPSVDLTNGNKTEMKPIQEAILQEKPINPSELPPNPFTEVLPKNTLSKSSTIERKANKVEFEAPVREEISQNWQEISKEKEGLLSLSKDEGASVEPIEKRDNQNIEIEEEEFW
ncbi:type IV secretory system conjugative DNA transfer family protein [Bacillus sp. 1P06AnD]|uniref:type IV secretory system conjugative DNA transfer family protein n=1 Tax=Bacillus sp. 1P06AnD TaxID=3132208 RepID=UPI0039A20594